MGFLDSFQAMGPIFAESFTPGMSPSLCCMIGLGFLACVAMARTASNGTLKNKSNGDWAWQQPSNGKTEMLLSFLLLSHYKPPRRHKQTESWTLQKATPQVLKIPKRSLEDTIGSQFYITLRELPFLDGKSFSQTKVRKLQQRLFYRKQKGFLCTYQW